MRLHDEEDEQIFVQCAGCEDREEVDSYQAIKHHPWMRHDAYGLCTGLYCDECMTNGKYPYRTDRYFDPGYAGERMDDDY